MAGRCAATPLEAIIYGGAGSMIFRISPYWSAIIMSGGTARATRDGLSGDRHSFRLARYRRGGLDRRHDEQPQLPHRDDRAACRCEIEKNSGIMYDPGGKRRSGALGYPDQPLCRPIRPAPLLTGLC